MLFLDRYVGETICIGEAIRLTVQGRMRSGVNLSVVAPAGTRLHFAGLSLEPATLPDGAWLYLFPLPAGHSFFIGDVEVGIGFPKDRDRAPSERERQTRIGINAPRSVAVHREEIYLRNLAQIGRMPILPQALKA